MNEQVEIKGDIIDLIYDNPDTGYRICAVRTEDDVVTVCGTMPDLFVGAEIMVKGKLGQHPIYGEQVVANEVSLSLPTTKSGIRAFLSSGLIPGIGPTIAKRIVDKFGNDTLDVIENAPHELNEISGLSPRKVQAICEAVAEHKDSSNAIMFFSNLGVNSTLAIRAYKAYGPNVIDFISENPYRLFEDVVGFSFQTCDQMGDKLGTPKDNDNRIEACIIHILRKIYISGHCYLPSDELFEELIRYCDISEEKYLECLDRLAERDKVVKAYREDKMIVFQKYIYTAERGIEKAIISLDKNRVSCSRKNIEKTIDAFEKENGIVLDENQKRAVMDAATSGFLVITGGPGTGKTTIIKAIIKAMNNENKKCFLAAPTGRAAKRMSSACNMEAKTLHRLLEVDGSLDDNETRNDEVIRFRRKPENPLDCDCLIIDEVSMVDTVLMYHTLRALRPGTQLVLVGDKDQLPSVGPGKVLKDIIESNLFGVVTLNDIYRQNSNSYISLNAHRVNLGEMPEMNSREGDFFLLSAPDGETCTQLTCDLVERRLPNAYGIDPFVDIQVITPNRKGNSGSEGLNKALQQRLNPGNAKKDQEFRLNDRVMQTKNNYDLTWEDYDDPTIVGDGVFNGEMGVIVNIDEKQKLVYVLFDDNRYVCYDRLHIGELELCYAITVHKSQGSEFDYCIIPIVNVSPQLRTRNLLYTAITRAKKMAIIIGTVDALKEMIDNNTELLRYTTLFDGYRKEAEE